MEHRGKNCRRLTAAEERFPVVDWKAGLHTPRCAPVEFVPPENVVNRYSDRGMEPKNPLERGRRCRIG
jgi:hypothetical protein